MAFERFTGAARSVVEGAVEVATGRGDPRIGAEHLLIAVADGPVPPAGTAGDLLGADGTMLLAMLDEWDSRVLADIGLDVALPSLDGSPDDLPPWPRKRRHLPLTHAARDTLDRSLEAARLLRDRHIGPEHILLGLLGISPDEPAGRLLGRLGVDAAAIRLEITARSRRSA